MTVEQLEERFPTVHWREPVPVRVPDLGERICCRVCIAEKGLPARGLLVSPFCFDDRAEFGRHFAEEHG